MTWDLPHGTRATDRGTVLIRTRIMATVARAALIGRATAFDVPGSAPGMFVATKNTANSSRQASGILVPQEVRCSLRVHHGIALHVAAEIFSTSATGVDPILVVVGDPGHEPRAAVYPASGFKTRGDHDPRAP